MLVIKNCLISKLIASQIVFLCLTFSCKSFVNQNEKRLESSLNFNDSNEKFLGQIKSASSFYGNESNFYDWNQNVNLILEINRRWVMDIERLIKSIQISQSNYSEFSPFYFVFKYPAQKIAINDDQKWFANHWLKVMEATQNNRKMFADIQGIQIRNFTELLKAENQAIKNQMDRLKNVAYEQYLIGYQQQVQNYIAYSSVIRTAYAQKIRNTQNLAKSITKMREYQKASNSCLFRARSLTRKIQSTAAEANLYRQTRWEKIADKLRFYANKDYGSFCLSSLMLSMHRMNQSQFANNLRYIHYNNPGQLAIVCPAGSTQDLVKKFPTIQELSDEDKDFFARDLDLAQYPSFFELNKDYTGVMLPVTPYQFYKLLTQNNPLLETSLVPTDTRSPIVDQCDRTRQKIGLSVTEYDKLFNNYTKLSRDFEDSLLEKMAQSEPKLTSNYLRFIKEASPIGAAKVPSKQHQDILAGMHRIFNATDQCINYMQNEDRISIENPPATESQPVTANSNQQANINNPNNSSTTLGFMEIHAPYFPEESRALQTCMANAIDLKKQAQLGIEMTQAIQTLLDNEAKTASPKGMLPMFGSDNNVIGPLPVANFN